MLKRNVFSSYFIEFSMVHSPSPPPSYMLGACNLGTATWALPCAITLVSLV